MVLYNTDVRFHVLGMTCFVLGYRRRGMEKRRVADQIGMLALVCSCPASGLRGVLLKGVRGGGHIQSGCAARF